MNEIENVLHALSEADRIERECAASLSAIFGEAIAELNALQARIDSGEFDV